MLFYSYVSLATNTEHRDSSSAPHPAPAAEGCLGLRFQTNDLDSFLKAMHGCASESVSSVREGQKMRGGGGRKTRA